MPVPAHVRLTFSGIFGTVALPAEIWAWNLNLSPRPFADEDERVSFATSVAALYQQYIIHTCSTSVRLTRIRAANVEAGGLVSKDAEGGYQQGDWEGDRPGSTTVTAEVPLQTAFCVSLMTNRAGARGKGRVFLPPLAHPIQPDFRYTDSHVNAARDRFAQFVQGINALSDNGAGGKVSVVSSFGFTTPVTEIRCGRVPDTMRSRRNALPEQYTSVLVGPATT